MRTHVNPGDQLDHYRIDEVLKHTPVATIFRATDVKTQQAVLIKIPQPDMETDPVFSERFQREEEIGRSLNHQGLLKAVNDGTRSRPYIVMQAFEGQPLRQVFLTQKKLPAARAEKIVSGLCDVLEYVENHGIAHRDIRPENILVGSDDQIKLINFGTAAMMGARAELLSPICRNPSEHLTTSLQKSWAVSAATRAVISTPPASSSMRCLPDRHRFRALILLTAWKNIRSRQKKLIPIFHLSCRKLSTGHLNPPLETAMRMRVKWQPTFGISIGSALRIGRNRRMQRDGRRIRRSSMQQ